MRTLVTGATGTLGQALLAEARSRNIEAVGLARRGSEIICDICDADALEEVFRQQTPDVIINCAAMIDISECTRNLTDSWKVNAHAVYQIANLCRKYGVRLLQVSTEHYWTGDGDLKHGEDAPVHLLNDYAMQKYAAEAFAGTVPGALIARVNIVGPRGWEKPTFAEWVQDVVLEDREAVLFEDSFTSSLDTPSCARALFDLIDVQAAGIVNVGSRDVVSKANFIRGVADYLGCTLTKAVSGSVFSLPIRRAESLGLDVSRAESLMGYRLPGLPDVINNLYANSKK